MAIADSRLPRTTENEVRALCYSLCPAGLPEVSRAMVTARPGALVNTYRIRYSRSRRPSPVASMIKVAMLISGSLFLEPQRSPSAFTSVPRWGHRPRTTRGRVSLAGVPDKFKAAAAALHNKVTGHLKRNPTSADIVYTVANRTETGPFTATVFLSAEIFGKDSAQPAANLTGAPKPTMKQALINVAEAAFKALPSVPSADDRPDVTLLRRFTNGARGNMVFTYTAEGELVTATVSLTCEVGEHGCKLPPMEAAGEPRSTKTQARKSAALKALEMLAKMA